MSIEKDELDNQSGSKQAVTSEDFELLELEAEQVAGGALAPEAPIGTQNVVGCTNLQGSCGS